MKSFYNSASINLTKVWSRMNKNWFYKTSALKNDENQFKHTMKRNFYFLIKNAIVWKQNIDTLLHFSYLNYSLQMFSKLNRIFLILIFKTLVLVLPNYLVDLELELQTNVHITFFTWRWSHYLTNSLSFS